MLFSRRENFDSFACAQRLAVRELSPPPGPESVLAQPVQPHRSEHSFRELLDRRYAAPFPCASPYQHGGLNE